jgi:glycosyltransferase involved in cell wall biosynthesis
MAPEMPLVSIGLPVYNGENFVAEAIQCVLDQTFSNWELIICDNGSTDRTATICRDYADHDDRIRVYQNERNMGLAFNFNEAFRLSRGRYFKWITHDDLFMPGLLESCIDELEKDQRVVMVFPMICYVDASGRRLRGQNSELSILGPTAESRVHKLMALEMQSTDVFWSLYGLVRSDVLRETGLMGLYNGSDQVLLLEFALRGCLKQIGKELFLRREHRLAATSRGGWTFRERAKFVNANDKRRLVFPYCRMLKEHLNCILTSSMPFWARLRCTAVVLKRFLAHWKYFAEEAVWSPLQALRSSWRAVGWLSGSRSRHIITSSRDAK